MQLENKNYFTMKFIAAIIFTLLLVYTNALAEDFDQFLEKKEEKDNQLRLKAFIQLTYTKSWELQRWRLLNGNEAEDTKLHLKKSMVVYAFSYWVLVKKKMIDSVPVFDTLIKKSFLNDELPLEMASNPLSPPLGSPGPKLGDDEYKILAREFVDFVSK
jgi:hypothetical protein